MWNGSVRNLNGCLLGGSADVYQGVARGWFVVGLTFEEGGPLCGGREPVRLVYMKRKASFPLRTWSVS